jgi:hypothetical protein
LDNALDSVATPAALLAGVVASAAVLIDLPPWLQWGVAIIGGAGVAGMTQGATTLLRLKTALASGGVANVLVAAAELFGAVVVSLLAIILPAVCLFLLLGIGAIVWRLGGHRIFGRRGRPQGPASA